MNGKVILARYQRLSKFFFGDSCLELGCSDGAGVPLLQPFFKEIVGVDGAWHAIEQAKESYSQDGISFECSYFEDLELDRQFDTVIMGHILEHVDDPKPVIDVAIRHLKPGGVLISDVPNAGSIHRELGVRMGLIRHVQELNASDLSIGHQRVYTRSEFRAEFERPELEILDEGGYLYKPFSFAQLELILDDAQLQTLIDFGAENPDQAAEIFVICRRK
jgi:2-polyprenyl-3-methyl-5-hydroxy-6-metoxy-1,4-benzoquinol methylase